MTTVTSRYDQIQRDGSISLICPYLIVMPEEENASVQSWMEMIRQPQAPRGKSPEQVVALMGPPYSKSSAAVPHSSPDASHQLTLLLHQKVLSFPRTGSPAVCLDLAVAFSCTGHGVEIYRQASLPADNLTRAPLNLTDAISPGLDLAPWTKAFFLHYSTLPPFHQAEPNL